MNIILDLTNTLGTAVDYDNPAGLVTFIEFGMTRNINNCISMSLNNFLLNPEEEAVKLIHSQMSGEKNMHLQDGFVVIKQANLKATGVKGFDIQIKNPHDQKIVDQASTGCDLQPGDIVIGIGGRSLLFEYLQINIELVLNGSIELSFDEGEMRFFSNFTDFTSNIEALNAEAFPRYKQLAKLFDPEFRNKILSTDFSGCTRVVKTYQRA